MSLIQKALIEAQKGLEDLLVNEESLITIEKASDLLIKTFQNGNSVFSCGNGGSMCDAIHFAEELTGQFRKGRKPLPALAISDPGYLSCVGNDLGFDQVFARFLEGFAKKGDCLLAISTSGSSRNVMEAVQYAQANGIWVIGLTSHRETQLAKKADIAICTPAGFYADRVQELHIKVIHILIELIERALFPLNYN